jgi:hypothetical protein
MNNIEIDYFGSILKIEVKRISSARKYTLRIHNGLRRAVLTMPVKGSIQTAFELAKKNAGWIHSRINHIPDAIPFIPHAEIWFKGQPHTLIHHQDKKGATWVEFIASDCKGFIHVNGDLPHFERRLKEFLRKAAFVELKSAVSSYCDLLHIPTPQLSLRDTKSRWGSCSADGSLSFSWRLIMAPEFVLNYLAAHEVCHLIHLNHSPDFWKLTRSQCPMTDEAELWLKKKGIELYKFGAA